jgi:retron-type reverse transcriptase
MRHGEDNGILYQLQHGFRRNRSCETQLIEFIDDLTQNLQEGLQTDVLIMDFAKAFDKVNHSLLIHKIHEIVDKLDQLCLTGSVPLEAVL